MRVAKIATFLMLLSSLCRAEIPEFRDYGANPGELTARFFQSSLSSAPLVILLHGCTQIGEDFAEQSGFLAQARSQKFNLLIPQQSNTNNAHLCFNWYNQADQQKDSGESLSLKNMIIHAMTLSQTRDVYIAGLSAGGAMTNIMLLNYPELFTAGAIIAGLPYPCAVDLKQALNCMKAGPSVSSQQSFNQSLAGRPNRWPKLTIWFGNKDEVVNPINGHRLTQQWATLTGAQPKDANSPSKSKFKISHWLDKNNRVRIQTVEFEDLGHGIPVSPSQPGGGQAGPYLLSAPLSAAIAITQFWRPTG